MGGGGHDWQDRETEREASAKEYYDSHKCSLDSFTDVQLQAELKKRKKAARTAEVIAAEKKKHNAPIERDIQALQIQLRKLNDKLKK